MFRLLVVGVMLLGTGQRAAVAAGVWSHELIALNGEAGIVSIANAAINNRGEVAVVALRAVDQGAVTADDPRLTLFIFQGGALVPVVLPGTELPGGQGRLVLRESASSRDLAIDDAGRIVFPGLVRGGTLAGGTTVHLFRWDGATVTHLVNLLDSVGPLAGRHLISNRTPDGRWLFSRSEGNGEIITYLLTDGAQVSEVARVTAVNTPCLSSFHDEPGGTMVTSAGHLVLVKQVQEQLQAVGDATCGSGGDRSTTTIQRFAPGQAAVDIASAAATLIPGSSRTGETITSTIVSPGGRAAFIRTQMVGVGFVHQLVRTDAVGEVVVLPPASFDPETGISLAKLADLDDQGRVVFLAGGQIGQPFSIYAGPDLERDRVLSLGESVGALPVDGFDVVDVAHPAGERGDRRQILVAFSVADASRRGLLLATREGARWNNRDGGAWSAPANWSPAAVPGSTTEVTFALDASYSVDVGAQRAGRVLVEDGGVGFVAADLALTGPLHVGGDASLTVAAGRLEAGELIVGNLPPLELTNEPTARFNGSGRTFALDVNGPIIVGEAGRGELFLTDGSVTAAELRISALAEGAVALGLPEMFFVVEGSVAVGDRAPGLLEVERGAGMLVNGDFVVGRGEPGAELVNEASRAIFRDAFKGSRGLASLGAGRIIVADRMPGRLEVLGGASVGAVGGQFSGAVLVTARVSNPAVFPDASILVSGEAGADTQSGLFGLGGVELSVAPGSSTEVRVEQGGQFSATGSVVLASAAGSSASVTVSGRGASGKPSLLDWSGLVSDGSGPVGVDVGHRGAAVVEVLDGARMEVRAMNIGRFSGSRGRVTVGSAEDGEPSQLEVVMRDENDTSGGMLIVGGTSLAGTDDTVVGILELDGGEVFVDGAMALGPKGVLRGRGSITGPAVDMFLAGTIEPGVALVKEPFRAPGSSRTFSAMARRSAAADASATTVRAAAVIGDPTLRLAGKVTLQPTAVVRLKIAGSGQVNGLVVDGPLTLGGTLEIAFANGYAPRAGDTLDLITSTSVTGAFATTTITGLAPEFDFTLVPNGSGGVRLTAVNDAVATTTVGSRLSNLSVRTALAETQNLIVGFVVQGGAKPMLVRAAGPGLATMIERTHPDPRITLFNTAGNAVDSNDNWPAELAATMQSLGAFPFAPASTDAALLRSANAAYTAHVNGPGSGIVLVELYDAEAGVSPRLVNASARNRVGTGADILIAGFVIEGSAPKTVLVRGVGPGLVDLGVTGVLDDPRLTVFQGGSPLAQNDDWSASLADVFATVGAFDLPTGSKDAALLVTLAPGIYTAQVSGVGATIGEALVEVYEVP